MRVLHAIVTLALLVGSAACASDPPRSPHAMHPIPEGRARTLIARTFQDAGTAPEADRLETVRERPVRLEVAAAGHTFGVAYLTRDDWSKAGESLPPRPTNGALAIAVGDRGTHILCLFADDYAEDDETGDEHRSTTIAADRRLQRDVRDFLHRAETQRWP